MKKLAILVFGGLLLQSCDKIEGPIKENYSTGPVDTTKIQRMVLVEEFTGNKCGNCPEGAEILERLRDTVFAGRVITIAVHAGSFAVPNAGGTKYRADYRTSTGEALNTKFGIVSYPSAAIARVQEAPGDYSYTTAQWSTQIQAELDKGEPNAGISITPNFNSGTRELSVQTQVYYKNAGSNASDYLVVYLTEDSLVSNQKDYRLPQGNQDITAYNHKHVLRAALSGDYGDQVSSTAVAQGQKVTKTFTYTLPAEVVWKNCHVVAFLTNYDSGEVLQAAEEGLK